MVLKKMLPLLLASTLATSSFAPCEANFSPKHVSHLMAGAYSILGFFSAKQLLCSIWRTFGIAISQEKEPLADFASLETKACSFGFLHLLNFASTAFFGYLTYFAMKNAIKELFKKHENERDKKERERLQKVNATKNLT